MCLFYSEVKIYVGYVPIFNSGEKFTRLLHTLEYRLYIEWMRWLYLLLLHGFEAKRTLS